MHLLSFQKSLCGKGTEIMQKNWFHAKKQKLFSNRICILFPSLESGINVGARLLIFEKKIKENKFENDRNALIDVKMNLKSDVKIFKRGGGYIYSRATSIPDSKVL